MIRKPVSSSVLGGLLVVICDDGTLWEYDPDGRWMEREPIPGTAEAIRKLGGSRYRGQGESEGNGGDKPWERGGQEFHHRRRQERRGRHEERRPERRDRDRDRRSR